MEKAYLILKDGTVFEGEAIGAPVDRVGELVFNTSVNGYLEMLSDPCYAGQIVVSTFPMLGAYGVNREDLLATPALNGLVVRDACPCPSNFRSEMNLDEYLREIGVPGIAGVDTRALTRILREHGTMNALLTRTPRTDLTPIRAYRVLDALATVPRAEKAVHPAKGEPRYRVALLDYGARGSIIDVLTALGCTVTSYPYDTDAAEILGENYDGLILTSGPGNPDEAPHQIAALMDLLGKLPIFAFGLGHALLALAAGAMTEKLKTGHRGSSLPVRDTENGRIYQTSQNHGYTVNPTTLKCGSVRFVSLSDGSCEGISYEKERALSVQFTPESVLVGEDADGLLREFLCILDAGGKR